jgi:hypothetical protein
MADDAKSVINWTSPNLEARHMAEKGGYGVIARTFIPAGEVVTTWGGKVITAEQLTKLSKTNQTHSVQVEENLFLMPFEGAPSEPADLINHSCDPNLGLSGQISLITLRDIEAGEELCFDYAMTDGSTYDQFTCVCQTPLCRGLITGNDWKLPELQERYAGYFSPYLQRRIDRLKSHRLPDESKSARNGRAKPLKAIS